MKPVTDPAYLLMHQGVLALSQVEANGIRVDTRYLQRAVRKTTHRIQKLTSLMKEDEVWKRWRRRYGHRANMGSREQLGQILFGEMGLECCGRTATGRPKTDQVALENLDIPFVKRFLEIEKLKKAKSTYLNGILKETVDDFLHPNQNLHLTQTYRSSSDKPNFQNIPIRIPAIAKLVRRAFVPRPGRWLVEIDYVGAEIRGAACYHRDPKMIQYIKDPTKDLHRDMACQNFLLSEQQVTKDCRYVAKNKFVFPQFYGDFYVHCAQHMWEDIQRLQLKTKDGIPLYKHLRQKGIKELGACQPGQEPVRGTFEYHVREVEHDFWNRRFRVYGQWKREWWEAYQRKGYFDTLTGFRIAGHYRRNEVINYPVQGSAFHWLLWSLIQIQRQLKKRRMKTLIIGQIHDSILADVPEKEVNDYIALASQIMTRSIRRHWKWIIVPLDIEVEVSSETWYDKRPIELEKGNE